MIDTKLIDSVNVRFAIGIGTVLHIRLKQLTTEPDSTPQKPAHSDESESPQELYYEHLLDAPDN